MVGSFQLSLIKRACGNVQPDAGAPNLFATCVCSLIRLFENRFMTSQLKSTQPAEFMQYTKFQQFTRCIYENFRCAFTSMHVSSKTRKNRLKNFTKHFLVSII